MSKSLSRTVFHSEPPKLNHKYLKIFSLITGSKGLIGNLNGKRCLPYKIELEEFKVLRYGTKFIDAKELRFYFKNPENNIIFGTDDLLDLCYELDENDSPSTFKLRCLNNIIPGFDLKVI